MSWPVPPAGHWFKGGWGAEVQQAIGAIMAVQWHVAEASERESVRCTGKFHTRFAKSSAQVLGWKRASWALCESAKVRSRLLDAIVRPLHEPSLVRFWEGWSTWEVSKSIFELKVLQWSNYRLNTEATAQGSESGSMGEPCTVRRDCGWQKADVGNEWVWGSKD